MVVTGQHVNNNTRRDGGPKPLMTPNMDCKIIQVGDSFQLTLRDKANPEFWINMTFSKEDIQSVS